MASLKLYAYNTIKQKIIRCEYPPNSLLNEEILKNDLGVSRTPIRDALGRLEQEYFIKILPKRGILIKGITIEEVDQVYEIRLLIEPYVLGKYGATVSPEVYGEFKRFFSRGLQRLPTETVNQKDDDFHSLFLNASNNPYLIQAGQFPFAQNIRIRILSANMGKERLKSSQDEHLLIIRQCCEKNWKKAAAALKDHLLISKKIAEEVVNNLTKSPMLLSSVHESTTSP
jgi:DNA-binding GntR family transcriptional regulator